MKLPSRERKTLTEDSEVKEVLAYLQAIVIYFDFVRNGGCEIAGSKQEVVKKRVFMQWNSLLLDVLAI